MANTYTLIASVTVGSGGAQPITFSSIPATYTDLLVKISARGTDGATQDRIGMKINGNAYGNWTLRWLGTSAGSVVSYTESAFGTNNVNYFPSTAATASTFGNTEVYIPNYTSSNYISISIDGVLESNQATTGIYFGLEAALWSQTNAITQLDFTTASANNFAQYSTAYLYGIKNS